MDAPRQRRLLALLDAVERIGNRLPDPLTLFVLFSLAVVVASAIAARSGAGVVHPVTGAAVTAVNLLSASGVRRMLTEAVANFAAFPPLGTVLATMIGVGVAEQSGLFSTGLRALVMMVPRSALTAALVFAGVNASIAADAGLVILPPLGALLFLSVGRHPMAGLSAAFAGVSGGFSANLLITPLDPLLAGLTQAAARLLDPDYVVAPTANYYFMIASTFMLTGVGTYVNHRFVEPRFGRYEGGGADEQLAPITRVERRGLVYAALAALAVLALAAALALPEGGVLRDHDGGLGPFFGSLVTFILLLFLAAGLAYGITTGVIRSDKNVAKMIADTLATMGSYIALAFVAAQFVAYFGWSNLGLIMAVKGAAALRAAGLTGAPLLVAIIVVCIAIDLLVASASAKWAVMGPVFVPMLMLLGYSPELVQATYRVGDSVANIITPLLPYFPLLITFARKYDPKAGVGTLIAATLPYSVAFGLVWTVMLVAWTLAVMPLGPAAPVHYIP
jgi:aminobenzoyl-glutamate transport protein